jgi:ATP-dependent DNA helicase RecG
MKFFEESEFIELKKSTSELKEAIKSIVAMLNKHSAGELYFGIRNDGTVLGQEVSDKTLRSVLAEHYAQPWEDGFRGWNLSAPLAT